MPLPEPRENENEEDFMQRCMADDIMNDEYEDPKQRNAVCQKQWDKDKEQGVNTMLRHTRYAMVPELLRDFLTVQKEMLEAKKGMTADDMRKAISDIYAGAQIYETPDNQTLGENDLYIRDENGGAHIPVAGILTPEVNPCAALFGDSETEYGFIRAAIAQAEADPKVQSLIFEIDSPGGYVDGVDETAAMIAQAKKPTTAMIHNMGASAAYWLASQADNIIAASPAAVVGSIGVAVETVDVSEAEAQMGIKRQVFTSTDAPDKRIDLSTEDGQERLVAELDDLHSVFARKVADGRGTTVDDVNTNYGRGGVVIAEKALRAGMIDNIIDYQKAPSLTGRKTTASSAEAEITEEESMEKEITLDVLRQEYPSVYQGAVDEGMKAERERRNALKQIAAQDPENEKLQDVVENAIEKGTASNDMALQTAVSVAIRDGNKLDGENPPEVETEPAGQDENKIVKETVEKLKKMGV